MIHGINRRYAHLFRELDDEVEIPVNESQKERDRQHYYYTYAYIYDIHHLGV